MKKYLLEICTRLDSERESIRRQTTLQVFFLVFCFLGILTIIGKAGASGVKETLKSIQTNDAKHIIATLSDRVDVGCLSTVIYPVLNHSDPNSRDIYHELLRKRCGNKPKLIAVSELPTCYESSEWVKHCYRGGSP